MRNLEIRLDTSKRIESSENDVSFWYHCADLNADFVLIDGKLCRSHHDEDKDTDILADLVSEGILHDGARVVGLISLPDVRSVLLGLSSGQLVQVGSEELGDVEEVGYVECGLECLVMSPDLEIITLVTSELVVITMTRDYVPIQETKLLQNEFGEGKFVNVGWGKKETQFHGKAGKDSRVVKTELGHIMAGDDGIVRISWRGDGQMFCVSYILPETDQSPRRQLRVLDRSGNLFSVSEECVGLEWCLSWKPSGSVIACTVKKHDKSLVCFFEKNGLQHGEFCLKNLEVVNGLAWSCDSQVLSIWSDNKIQLWVRGNYHWYCKQEVVISGLVTQLAWDNENPTVMRFLSKGSSFKEIRTLKLDWVTNVSRGNDDSDLSMCGVIDGDKVLVTPFRELVVPPPAAAFEVHVGTQVQQVLFPMSNNMILGENLLARGSRDSNSMLVVTRDKVVLFSRGDGNNKSVDPYVSVTGSGGGGFVVKSTTYYSQGSLFAEELLDGVSNLIWVGDKLIGSSSHPVCVIHVMKECDGKLQLVTTLQCEDNVYSITPCPGGAIAQLVTGLLLQVILEGDEAKLLPMCVQFPALCSPVIWTTFGTLGLTNRFRLYLNREELANNVTSVTLHSHFLLATTLDHRLVSLPLEKLASNKVEWSSASNRRVERGSRLVCAVSKHSKTVLQMPRGNLEVIHPRSLSIKLVVDLLESRKYLDAFILARRQRMNLNVLVDHNITDFLSNCDKFVAQISPNPDHMNIFIADLLDENVCMTMYSSEYTDKQSQYLGKVSKVCCRIRDELVKQDVCKFNSSNLLPILGTLVRDGNRLEEALQRIKIIKEGGKKSLVDNALRFLTYMVDVNALFDVALGTYDFDLVLMVAEKSQKDPKEYLPFLNNFKQMDESFMKYSVDKHLKRYESALTNIAKCDNKFDLCMQLINDFKLYKSALELYDTKSNQYKQVCLHYAKYLESKRYHEEASMLYERSGNMDCAIGQAALALSWQRAGYLSRKAGWPVSRLSELYRDLSSKLETSGRGKDASVILKEWLQDPEEAVAVLCRSHQWEEALRIVRDSNRDDLVETNVKPALIERRDVLTDSIESVKKQLKAFVERLILVRRTRNFALQNDCDNDIEDDRNVDDADLFSETTSVGGASTIRSRSTLQTRTSSRSKSSKNRRKADRKLYSTKEGSMYEDIGIMAAVHELLCGVPAVKDEISKVIRSLADIGVLEKLKSLQEKFQFLLDQIDAAIPIVWHDDKEISDQEKFGPEATVEDIIRGGIPDICYKSPVHLLPVNLRYPPTIKKDETWKLVFL